MSSHTAETRLGLIGKLLLDGEMTCETGLHIGAGKGSLDLGGADNPVVKDAFGRPYVPGSSLRGKLRSLLEQSSGQITPADLVYLSRRRGQEVRIHQSDEPGDEVCLLFGRNPGRTERASGETYVSISSGEGWSPPVNVTNNAARRSFASKQTSVASNIAILKSYYPGPAAATFDRQGHLQLLKGANEGLHRPEAR